VTSGSPFTGSGVCVKGGIATDGPSKDEPSMMTPTGSAGSKSGIRAKDAAKLSRRAAGRVVGSVGAADAPGEGAGSTSSSTLKARRR
jgi:hypothetical protein